jgi:hypothetical protein
VSDPRDSPQALAFQWTSRQMDDLCTLLVGNVVDWPGLTPFPIERVPSCLGADAGRGWLQFGTEYVPYRVFRPGGKDPHVWLFSWNGVVQLVEVFALPKSVTIESVSTQLTPPRKVIELPLEVRMQRPLLDPDERATELVFPHRGIAILVGRKSPMHARIVRLRAFEPMSPEQYAEQYVRLPPIRFQPP